MAKHLGYVYIEMIYSVKIIFYDDIAFFSAKMQGEYLRDAFPKAHCFLVTCMPKLHDAETWLHCLYDYTEALHSLELTFAISLLLLHHQVINEEAARPTRPALRQPCCFCIILH